MRELSLQEKFWSGDFGNTYIERNNDNDIISCNISLFSNIFKRINRNECKSILELGANIGLNLIAIHSLLQNAELHAVEINKTAVAILSQLDYVKVFNNSIYDFECSQKYDLVFTKGVLIHQNPDLLTNAYEILYKASRKYILICEYYNPTPVEVEYRGTKSVLFKRDFAGEILDKHDDVKLVDYGFAYHRDIAFPNGDFNWFLLEKMKG